MENLKDNYLESWNTSIMAEVAELDKDQTAKMIAALRWNICIMGKKMKLLAELHGIVLESKAVVIEGIARCQYIYVPRTVL